MSPLSVVRRLAVLTLFAAAVGVPVAAHAIGVEDVLVQPPTLSAPERGSMAGSYGATSFSASELSRGAFALPSALTAPTDRGPLLARIFPSYSPDAGQGEWGLGWSTSLTITRAPLVGPLSFDSDEFTSPWGRLVAGDDGYFYPSGLGSSVRLRFESDQWEAIQPDGTRLFFSRTLMGTSGTYAWYLTRAVDVLGETTLLTYEQNSSGRPFLASVVYGARQRGDYRIVFAYESLAVPFVDYRSGLAHRLDRRVRRVDVEVRHATSGVYVPRFHFDLAYTASPLGPSFFLTSVTKTFASGQSEPPVTYDFDMGDQQFLARPAQSVPSLDGLVAATGSWAFKPSYVTIADMERDGIAELEYRGLFTLARRTGTGWSFEALPAATGGEHPRCRPSVQQSRLPRNLAHLTAGNGQPLVFVARNVPGQDGTEVVVCDRAGLPLYEAGLSGRWELGANTRLIDLDRDDHPDVIRVFQGGYQILRNVSAGAAIAFSAEPVQGVDLPFMPNATWVTDLNGDGLPDIVAAHPAGLSVFHGLGDGGFLNQRVQMRFHTQGGLPFTQLDQREVHFVDLNKDGLEDVVLQAGRSLSVYANRGHGFQEIAAPAVSTLPLGASSPTFADLTASGETQLLYVYRSRAQSVALAKAGTGLLRSTLDGKGTRLSFYYGRGPAGVGVGQRPVVLSELLVESTGQDAVSYFYDYGDPVMHTRNRALIGFGLTVAESPQTDTATYFHHDDDVSGLTKESSVADLRTQVQAFTEHAYAERSFHGVRYLRKERELSGYRGASGQEPVSQEKIHTVFARELCPVRSETTLAQGQRVTDIALAAPATLTDALHCMVEEERQAGSHTDSSLDYEHGYRVTRNAAGQATSIRLLGGAGEVEVQRIDYDPEGRAVRVEDPEKGVLTATYDAGTTRPASLTMADGVVTTASYDPVTALMLSLEERRGHVAFVQQFRFDGLERLNKRWDNQGTSSESRPGLELLYSYATQTQPASYRESQLMSDSVRTQVVHFESAAGKELGKSTLTANGWIIEGLTKLLPGELAAEHLVRSPLSGPTDPQGITLATLYSGATVLSREDSSALSLLGSVREVQREGVVRNVDTQLALVQGRLVQSTRENGVVAGSVELAVDGQVLARTDASGARTTYTLDVGGRLRQVRLPTGETQRVFFDDYGRISRVDRDGLGGVEFRYDAKSRLAEKIFHHRDGIERRYLITRDAAGRILREEHLTPGGDASRFDFIFDETAFGQRGRLIEVRGDGFSRTTKYRPDGREAELTVSFPGWRSVTTRQVYYDDGTLKSVERIVLDADGDELAHYTRNHDIDSFGRDSGVRIDGQPLFSYGFDAQGQVDRVNLPAGEVLRLHRDPVTRAQRGYTLSATSFELSADRVKNARGLVEQDAYDFTSAAGATSFDRSYAYDARGFLTGVQTDQGHESYAYDPSGRLSRMVDAAGDRALTRTQSSLTAGAIHYELDAAGRVIRRGELDLTYGAQGQVSFAHHGDRYVEYFYDEAGVRVLKRVNGAEEEGYAFGGVLTEDGFVEPISVQGRFIGVLVDGRFQSIALDPRGSVLADHDGTLRPVSAYGVRAAQSHLSSVIAYAARGYDQDLGTVRMGVRDYDPVLGQFWSKDPLFSENIDKCSESPIECNLFGYARNNPVSFIDPAGTESYSYDMRVENGTLRVTVDVADIGLMLRSSATRGVEYVDATINWIPDQGPGIPRGWTMNAMVTVTALSEDGWREVGGKKRSAAWGGKAHTTIITGGIGGDVLNMGLTHTRVSGQKRNVLQTYQTAGTVEVFIKGSKGKGLISLFTIGSEKAPVSVFFSRMVDQEQVGSSTYWGSAVGVTLSGKDPTSADAWLGYDPNGNPVVYRPE